MKEFTEREIEKLTEWFIEKVKSIKHQKEPSTIGETTIINGYSVGFRFTKIIKKSPKAL